MKGKDLKSNFFAHTFYLEMALIESAESSNRIEGVTVEKKRLKPLIIGHSRPRDRSEEEVAMFLPTSELLIRKE